MQRPTPLAWAAFAAMVVIAGANIVLVKISNEELAPFWGAFLRFFYASLFLLAYVVLRRIPMPRGRALLGTVVYGVTSFGISYALAYRVLREVPSGLVAVLFAFGPLLTMIFASAHGLERLRTRAILGALLATVGIGLILREQLRLDVEPLFLVLALVGLVVMAESSVLVKYFPRPHPAAMNAIGMLIGAAFLLALSFAASEPWMAPGTLRNFLAVAYLTLIGSIGLFGLFLYALARMDVSVISYQFVLMPVVTVLLANVLIGETFTWTFFAGAFVVAMGVFLGLSHARTTTPMTPAPIVEPANPPRP